MKPGNIFFLFALFPLIPASSTLAYGIVISIAIVWYFLSGILCKRLVSMIDAGPAGIVAELVCLGGSASLFLCFLRAFSPLIAVSLSLYAILSGFTFVLLVSIDRFPEISGFQIPVLRFIPFYLLFSALRELLSFGSLSVPVRSGTMTFPILPAFDSYRLGFWGTTGGALILLGLIAWLAKYLNRRISAYRRNAQ